MPGEKQVVMNEASAPELPAPAGAGEQPQGSAAPGQPPAAGSPSSPSPSSSGTPEAGSPGSGPSTEPLFEIKVDGKVEKLSRDEIIAMAQMGKDYTQKNQKLADAKRAFEAERQSLVQQEVDRARQEWARQQQESARRQESDRLRAEDPAAHALAEAKRAQQMVEDQSLDMEIKRALGKFPDISENDLLLEAQRSGIQRPEQFGMLSDLAAKIDANRVERMEKWLETVVTEGKHPRLGKYKDEIIAAYLKEKEAKPGPLVGSGGSPISAPAPRRAKSLEEAADMANEMMGAGERG